MEETGCKIICGAPTTLAVEVLLLLLLLLLKTMNFCKENCRMLKRSQTMRRTKTAEADYSPYSASISEKVSGATVDNYFLAVRSLCDRIMNFERITLRGAFCGNF